MSKKIYFPDLYGNKLCGILSNPAKDQSQPIVIMLHGFISDKNSKKILELEKRFNEKGISTFRFDAFGHGESEGSFAEVTITEAVNDILQAITYLKKQGYTQIGLIGSSFGGMASIMAASKTKAIFILGLICPVSDYEEVEYNRRGPKELEQWKKNGFTYALNEKTGEKFKLNYTFFEDFKNNQAYIAAQKIKIPTIIIHGDADNVVPIEQTKKLVKSIKNSKLIIIKGADHYFSSESHFQQLINTLCAEFLQSTSVS